MELRNVEDSYRHIENAYILWVSAPTLNLHPRTKQRRGSVEKNKLIDNIKIHFKKLHSS